MSKSKVVEQLRKYNKENDIITLEDTSTVLKAAISLGVDEDEIAKTLSFIVDNKPILIVMSGKSKIDNSKYKNYFKTKCKMIEYDLVENYIGHKPGGVCPFGVNEGVKIYLDESLKKHNYVYPACGEIDNAIKLSIKELEDISNYSNYIDVTKEGNI